MATPFANLAMPKTKFCRESGSLRPSRTGVWTLSAFPTVRSVLLDLRAVSLTLPGQRRLTNRKTSRARRAPFAIPHDQYRGSRSRIYALHRVRQDRDREGWVASRSAI